MATAIISSTKPHRWFKRNKSGPRESPVTPCPAKIGLTRREEYERVFRHFDANGDGNISSDELRAYFASIGESFSGDDESLDFESFVRLMERDEGDSREDLRKAFEMFEANKGSGRITPESLRVMLSRLGDSRSNRECVSMIRAFDIDGDGVLDFHEFVRMMTAN